MATTYNNLYLDVRKTLRAAGVEGAAIEARELVCYASGKNRQEFFRDMQLYTTTEIEHRTAELLKRRLAGEPVAYIIGEWEFYGLTFDIDEHVLVPRMDTEVLAERAILAARACERGSRVLDLCCGSGCVGLAVAVNAQDSKVTLADISEEALGVAKRNIRRYEMTGRVVPVQADARQDPPAVLGSFDVIACNPPYIPTEDIETLDVTVRGYEPTLALDGGADGLDFYRDIAAKWKNALKPGGTLIFEIGINEFEDVMKLMRENGYSEIQGFKDTGDIWRVVEGKKY